VRKCPTAAREFLFEPLFKEQGYVLNPAIQWLGVVICACGMAFAIWARFHLGRNWGMPMSLKKDAELVTTGPYAYVRHPIYTGMILAMLGTTLVIIWWAVPLVAFFVYFVYSAKTEEKIMLGEFGARYTEYMKHTKMLIPFVF
jgi:protein-S-isoprenylcysteine O-methyltransferase Ste14